MNNAQHTQNPRGFFRLGLIGLISLLSILVIVSGCSTPSNQAEDSTPQEIQAANLWIPDEPLPEEPPFPSYPLNPQDGPNQVLAFLPGTILEVAEDYWGGFRIVLEVPNNYFWEGEKIESSYELVIGNLQSVQAVVGPVEQGAELGIAQESSYVVSRTSQLDRNMLRETQTFPVFFAGGWWFQPAWLLPEHLGYLSFRQVTDPGPTALEFIRSQESIREEGATFSLSFDDPELQSIRFPITLDALPGPADRTDALDQTEMVLFGQTGVFGLSQTLDLSEGQAELYWLAGYDEYLAQEIGMGEVVWVYAYMYTVDWENNRALILARDFAPFSDEEVIEVRMEELTTTYPDMVLELAPLE